MQRPPITLSVGATPTSSPGSQRKQSFHLMGDVPALCAFALVAGIVDCACFTGLYQLFTAHTTGNLVITISYLVNDGINSADGWARLVLIPLFCSGCMIISLLSYLMEFNEVGSASNQRLTAGTLLLAVNTVQHAIAWAVAVSYQHEVAAAGSPDNFYVLLVGGLATFTMGQQLVVQQANMKGYPMTTIQTGNVLTIINELTHVMLLHVRRCLHRRHQSSEEHQALLSQMAAEHTGAVKKIKISSLSTFAFMLGCVLGGLLISYAKWWVLAVPTFVMAVLTVDSCRWTK